MRLFLTSASTWHAYFLFPDSTCHPTCSWRTCPTQMSNKLTGFYRAAADLWWSSATPSPWRECFPVQPDTAPDSRLAPPTLLGRHWCLPDQAVSPHFLQENKDGRMSTSFLLFSHAKQNDPNKKMIGSPMSGAFVLNDDSTTAKDTCVVPLVCFMYLIVRRMHQMQRSTTRCPRYLLDRLDRIQLWHHTSSLQQTNVVSGCKQFDSQMKCTISLGQLWPVRQAVGPAGQRRSWSCTRHSGWVCDEMLVEARVRADARKGWAVRVPSDKHPLQLVPEHSPLPSRATCIFWTRCDMQTCNERFQSETFRLWNFFPRKTGWVTQVSNQPFCD